MKAPAVGGTVDSWCTRCKLLLAHTVEAIVGGRITRVHCNTCRAQHAYRPQAPGAGSAGPGRPRPSRAPRAAAPRVQRDQYAALVGTRTAASARRYAPADRFAPHELIAHTTFGLGVVLACKDGTKIEVLFPDGVKVLAHGR